MEKDHDGRRRRTERAAARQPPRAIWQPDPVQWHGRCAVRAAPDLRQRGRCHRSQCAPTVRGARTVDARYPLPALAPHAANLRSREPQANLLSFPGVPDRPVAGQQHPQPAPRSRCPAHRRRQEARLDGHPRGGTRRRPRQWRARPPRGVLPRFDGNDAAPGDGLRAALRVRHFPPDHRERLATRAPGQLAAPSRSLGGRPAAGDG